MDTETTGLDVTNARLIQIGIVGINQGVVDMEKTFDTLVNPGIPIPPSSSKIHGLYDADVAGAEPFSSLKDDLDRWIGNSIIIGYSIGFDLAILKRECELAGQTWEPPRTIDVRHVVKIISPQLPDSSLDTLAGWLGVDSSLRHQALGDAVITAEVFLKLVPELMRRDIRTLAQLEAACRTANDESIKESQAGWYDFLYSDRPEDAANRALARVDSYPYRHRVRDVMSSPPLLLEWTTPVREALGIIMDNQVSSVFVKGDDGSGYGIITERDILRAINRDPGTALESSIGNLASFPLKSIDESAFLYRAMGRMVRGNYRHLGVTDSEGALVGALSSRDLLRQRADDALNLGDAIDHARNEAELAVVWANLALVATALDSEEVDARDIAAVISRELCALTRRACEIAEQELSDQGMGGPPVPYAMMVLGSGGRGESLLAMDQDNAIVYASGEPGGPEDQWFEALGARVADLLHAAGIPYCKGGIMASKAEWRMSVDSWKEEIATWITRTSPEDTLKIDIFFDAVCVHGDRRLTDEIIGNAMETASQSRDFLHLMASSAADVNSPLGLFGRFRLEDGRVDIKLGGILPIISAARVEAIRHVVADRSTPGRLRAVESLIEAPETLIDNLDEAHHIILDCILKQQLFDLDNGIALSNRVAPAEMSPVLRSNLKWALEQVPSVADLVGVPRI